MEVKTQRIFLHIVKITLDFPAEAVIKDSQTISSHAGITPSATDTPVRQPPQTASPQWEEPCTPSTPSYRQVVPSLPKFSTCFVNTKQEDLKTMLNHGIQYTQAYIPCHQIIYLESELKEHLTDVKGMFIVIASDQPYNLSRTNYQINFILFLQDWGLSKTSNLGSKKRK